MSAAGQAHEEAPLVRVIPGAMLNGPFAWEVIRQRQEADAATILQACETILKLSNSALALAAATEQSMQQFESYARQHRAKGTPDADAKAKVNDEMAARCRAALEFRPE